MEITIKEVEHLADLSALNLSEEQKNAFVTDLNNILDMINQLQETQTQDVNFFNKSHKLSELREDVKQPSYPQEEILKNAPKARRGAFNVPLVVE